MGKLKPVLYQAVALELWVKDGRLEVLLIISCDTGRWVIPKGNIDSGLMVGKIAEHAATDEIGLEASTDSCFPIGIYTHGNEPYLRDKVDILDLSASNDRSLSAMRCKAERQVTGNALAQIRLAVAGASDCRRQRIGLGASA